MKFELTLYAVLVFLVPGSVTVGTLRFWSHAVDMLVANLLTSPTAVAAAVVVAGAFGVGAIIDSLRTLAVDPLVNALVKMLEEKEKKRKNVASEVNKDQARNYLAKLNKDNLPVFEFVLQRTFEYYRFNANTTLALVLLSVSCFWVNVISLVCVASLIGALLFLWVAVRQRRVSLWAMEQFH
jgi:hypothetical protein